MGSVCSLDGGTGGSSGSERLEFSPSGPSGPRESSMASRRVACAPTFRGVRGPLALGDLGVGVAEREDACDCFALVAESVKTHEPENEHELAIRQTLFYSFCSFGKIGIGA